MNYKHKLKKGILYFLGIYVFLMILILIDGLFDNKIQNSQYAIVYGNEVLENGEVSSRLKARLDKSINLYSQGKVKKIIVSGGIGNSGFDEAKIMKKYLISKGIKDKSIIVDSKGNTTKLTSQNSYKLINNSKVGVIGVSQFYHMARVKLSLKKEGFKYVGTASPNYFELRDIYSLFREVPAYIKYIFY